MKWKRSSDIGTARPEPPGGYRVIVRLLDDTSTLLGYDPGISAHVETALVASDSDFKIVSYHLSAWSLNICNKVTVKLYYMFSPPKA